MGDGVAVGVNVGISVFEASTIVVVTTVAIFGEEVRVAGTGVGLTELTSPVPDRPVQDESVIDINKKNKIGIFIKSAVFTYNCQYYTET